MGESATDEVLVHTSKFLAQKNNAETRPLAISFENHILFITIIHVFHVPVSIVLSYMTDRYMRFGDVESKRSLRGGESLERRNLRRAEHVGTVVTVQSSGWIR